MGSGSSIISNRKINRIKYIRVRKLVSKFRKNNPKSCINSRGQYISKNIMVKLVYRQQCSYRKFLNKDKY